MCFKDFGFAKEKAILAPPPQIGGGIADVLYRKRSRLVLVSATERAI
jgi:hypothetical protein